MHFLKFIECLLCLSFTLGHGRYSHELLIPYTDADWALEG